MKTLNITFEDEDYDLLSEAKGEDLGWRDFFLTLVKPKTRDKK